MLMVLLSAGPPHPLSVLIPGAPTLSSPPYSMSHVLVVVSGSRSVRPSRRPVGCPRPWPFGLLLSGLFCCCCCCGVRDGACGWLLHLLLLPKSAIVKWIPPTVSQVAVRVTGQWLVERKMGQGGSRSCVDDWACGTAKRHRPNSVLDAPDPALETVRQWIDAREQGDMELAASFCHPEFVFASPQVRTA